MGTKYTTTGISGYDTSPPSDDGSATAANQVSWAKHKTKLTGPIKDAFESLNTKLLADTDTTVVNTSSSGSIGASYHRKTVTVSGASTLTLDNAATLGDGFYVTVVNIDASNLPIINTTSSESIDGGTSFTFSEQYEAVKLFCNGSQFYTVGDSVPKQPPTITTHTTSATHTFDTAAKYALIEVQGPGGGGGGSEATDAGKSSAGGGGGAGGYCRKFIDLASIASGTVTIGTGGAGGIGASSGTAGSANSVWSDGTNTLTGDFGSGGGHTGNAAAFNTAIGGAGGNATGGTVNVDGDVGGYATKSGENGISGSGGACTLGGSRSGQRNTTANGGDGPNYGSGGAGAFTTGAGGGARNGGDGADGVVIVTEFFA